MILLIGAMRSRQLVRYDQHQHRRDHARIWPCRGYLSGGRRLKWRCGKRADTLHSNPRQSGVSVVPMVLMHVIKFKRQHLLRLSNQQVTSVAVCHMLQTSGLHMHPGKGCGAAARDNGFIYGAPGPKASKPVLLCTYAASLVCTADQIRNGGCNNAAHCCAGAIAGLFGEVQPCMHNMLDMCSVQLVVVANWQTQCCQISCKHSTAFIRGRLLLEMSAGFGPTWSNHHAGRPKRKSCWQRNYLHRPDVH